MSIDFIFSRPEWQNHAACKGMMRSDDSPKFFIKRGDQKSMLSKAKKVCEKCPVKDECLEFALKFNIQEGVWGGASGRQRRRMRSEQGYTDSLDTYGFDLSAAAMQAKEDRIKISKRQGPIDELSGWE